MKKGVTLVISSILIAFLILNIVSAQDMISTSDKGLITTTITTKQIGALDKLFSIFKNLFTIVIPKTTYEKGEIISVTSGFEVDSCASTSVQISLIKSGLTIDTDTINVGSIYQQSITARHDISTSSLSAGTYVLQDYWLCGGAFPITSIMGTPNPSTKTITITEKVSTCTENWNCNSWGLCPSGVQFRTCTDSNNCGTSFNKPATSQSCTPACTPDCNGKCGGVSNGCGGTCDATCGTQTTDEHNKAEISEIKIDKSVVAERGTVTVTGKIKNKLSTSQKVLLELAIIPPSVADAWFIPYETTTAKGEMKWWNWALLLTKFPTLFATVEYTPQLQCCQGQANVDDYWVTLEPNEEYPFSFTVKAPHDNITDLCGSTRYWAGYGDYVLYAYLTTGCSPNGTKQGVSTTRIEVSKLDKESRTSLTKKEWEDAIDLEEWKTIISSMCTSTTQCSKKEDYEVECTKSDDIWDGNYQAVKDNCGEFISQVSLMMSWGILPEKFGNLGCTVFGWLTEYKEDIPRGTCRLSKGAGDICGFFEKTAWFSITGDDCLDGGIIMAVLLVLAVIIFSRLSGIFYFGEIEK